MDAKQKALESVYEHFAEHGPNGISFKRITKEFGIPNSELISHFRNKNDLIDEILEKHFKEMENYLRLCQKHCKIYSDLHKILMQFPVSLKFHIQLFLHRDIPLYNLVYIEGNLLLKDLLVPKFMVYYDLLMPLLTAEAMWLALVDAWYLRLDIDNLNTKNLQAITDRIMNVMVKFRHSLN